MSARICLWSPGRWLTQWVEGISRDCPAVAILALNVLLFYVGPCWRLAVRLPRRMTSNNSTMRALGKSVRWLIAKPGAGEPRFGLPCNSPLAASTNRDASPYPSRFSFSPSAPTRALPGSGTPACSGRRSAHRSSPSTSPCACRSRSRYVQTRSLPAPGSANPAIPAVTPTCSKGPAAARRL